MPAALHSAQESQKLRLPKARRSPAGRRIDVLIDRPHPVMPLNEPDGGGHTDFSKRSATRVHPLSAEGNRQTCCEAADREWHRAGRMNASFRRPYVQRATKELSGRGEDVHQELLACPRS